MSSAFINNSASNGAQTFTSESSAKAFAETLQKQDSGCHYLACYVQRYDNWRIAKQNIHGRFIEWVEE